MKNEYICHMYGNFSKANMDTQTSSHMLLKNDSTEALNQILFPARERVIFEHLVFYYIITVLWLEYRAGANWVRCPERHTGIFFS